MQYQVCRLLVTVLLLVASFAALSIDAQVVDPSCRVDTKDVECRRAGGGYLYTFTVTNNTGDDVTSVLVTPPPNSGYTITPQTPPLPGGVLPNGQSVTLQVTITGGGPGRFCFTVTLMTKERSCCTVEMCVDLPGCCVTARDPRIECGPNGSFTYTTAFTNNTTDTVQHIYLYPPAGVTMTPNYFAVSLAPGQTSQQVTITITGAQPGSRLCYSISLHPEGMRSCCTEEICIELPDCGGCADGRCCSRAPEYPQSPFNGQRKTAAVTGYRFIPNGTQNYVLTVFDITGANGFALNANNTPPKYNGPAAKPWTIENLGTIFGVDMDHLGNIYVTASSAYGGDTFPGGAGAIYRIDNGTGAITPWATLPNTPDPNVGGFPALGNIAFDCSSKQFFVTNEDDGRIYRLRSVGNTGQVLSTYDHKDVVVAAGGGPDPNDQPGFARLGERLWGVQVHNGRVYYSVWGEDCGNQNATTSNEIWSIGLMVNGDFDVNDRRMELTVPDLPGASFSNPTSDIAFGRDGRMLLAERTMYAPSAAQSATLPNAHASRVLEYLCTRDGWRLSAPFGNLPFHYNTGVSASAQCPVAVAPANATGGVDYDFDPNATFGMWATSDVMQATPQLLYGMQGFPLAGGSAITSPLVALYGPGSFKTMIGDVEISCPAGSISY